MGHLPAGCFVDFNDYLNQPEEDPSELTDEMEVWDGDLAQHEMKERDLGAR
jgi:hypothetical protein